MPLERLETRRGCHDGISYEIKIYYSPPNAYTDDERLVVVDPTKYVPVESVYDSTPLNPTSMIPWKDPDPLAKDPHVERAVSTFENRVESFNEQTAKANQ